MFQQQGTFGTRILDVLLKVVRSGAISVEVFLHRRFGPRYLGMQAVRGMGLIGLSMLFCTPNESLAFVLYLALYLIAWWGNAIDVWRRFHRGDNEHSAYSGFPRLLRANAAHREHRVKQFCEPIIIACIAYLAYDWNPPLAWYLVFAATCLVVSNALFYAWQTHQAMDLHDTVIEQRQKTERFRQIQGNGN